MEEQLLKKMDRLIDLSHKFSKSKGNYFRMISQRPLVFFLVI
jgi:hypothetical protein